MCVDLTMENNEKETLGEEFEIVLYLGSVRLTDQM